MIDELFLQLLQVSLGNRDGLSRCPSTAEWEALYTEARQQSVVGVCLEALQKNGGNWGDRNGLSPDQKLRWIGRGERIADNNRKLNQQCAKLCGKLTESGFWNCILKGQAVARLYPHPEYRQSGDIDVWISASRQELVEMARRITGKHTRVTYHHCEFDVFPDTPVEIHFTPTWMFNPVWNHRLQQWFADHRVAQKRGDFPVPTVEFDVVFILVHIFRHVFDEGVGMRQIIDYYYVLREARGAYRPSLAHLGLMRFASGMMWLMQHALGMPREWMIAEPDARVGEWLLREVMTAGNFGRKDPRNQGVTLSSPRLVRLRWRVSQSCRRMWLFPSETLFEMPWRIVHYVWRWRKGYL